MVDPQDLMLTALRASLLYFALLIVIRLLGKRSVGAISAFDLLVALMLGEVVDEAIFGDVSLTKGLLAIGVIAAWHFIDEFASSRSAKIDRLTAGEPTVLIRHGEFDEKALASERLNRSEVLAQMRLQGIDDTNDIKTATLETSGQISFIKEKAAEPVTRADWELVEEQG
jgi:uncharacterized membrane protein YcaP (DUF421 family)